MIAKQLSVFIVNKKGRLSEVLNGLKKNGINILSLSLADTTEYGLLRLVVDDAEKGKEKLNSEGFLTELTDVLIVSIAHKTGSLQKLVEILSNKGVNIEYMYGLSIQGDNAFVVLKASDNKLADAIFAENNVKTFTNEEILKA